MFHSLNASWDVSLLLHIFAFVLISEVPMTMQQSAILTDSFNRSTATSVVVPTKWVLKCAAVCGQEVICVAYDPISPLPYMTLW